MRRYTYWRLHIPTGERSQGEMDACNELMLLQTLDGYNRNQPGVWQYWRA